MLVAEPKRSRRNDKDSERSWWDENHPGSQSLYCAVWLWYCHSIIFRPLVAVDKPLAKVVKACVTVRMD